MNRHTQVERLVPAAAGIAIGKLLAQPLQNAEMVADWAAYHHAARVVDRLPDLLATRHFTNADVPFVVREDRNVAGEEWPMRSAQIEQHAIAPSDWDDAEIRDQRGWHGHLVVRSPRSVAGLDRSWPR